MKALRTIIESNFANGYNEDHDATAKLNARLREHYNKFNDAHKLDIQEYTHSDPTLNSYPLNDYQWKKHEYAQHDKEYSIDHLDARTQRMDSVINAHRTPHKLTLYSGIRYDPRDRMDSNRIVHHPAYLSGSIMKYQAQGFGLTTYKDGPAIKRTSKTKAVPPKSEKFTHILNIRVPKNHPGAYVSEHSRSPDEREFILPRGTNLRYIHTQHHRVKDHYAYSWEGDKHQNFYEHHMEVV